MTENQVQNTSSAPYEAPLTKAFDKLTSQVFIFLLAYVILLIGLAVFGSEMATTLRNLFYIIPILGVVAYLWLRQSEIAKKASKQGIDISSGIVSVFTRKVQDQAVIKGATGVQGDLSSSVTVDVDSAKGQAQVIGMEYAAPSKPESPQNVDAQQLLLVFNQLDPADQGKLLMSALRMREKARKDNEP